MPHAATPKYQCAACCLAVAVTPDGTIIRGCRCDAGVVANMQATAHGAGALSVARKSR